MLLIIVVLFLLNTSCHGYLNDFPGETYVRWGRTVCPNDSSLVYKVQIKSKPMEDQKPKDVQWLIEKNNNIKDLKGTGKSGYAGGNHFNEGGSGSNFLCLPEKPEWKDFTDGRGSGVGRIYGVEYEIFYNKPYSKSFHNKNMPCAVCMTTRRPTVLMIPAKISCPKGWQKEYSGYLMSQNTFSGRTSTEYICVDEQLESVPGGDANENQAVVYPVEASCGQLECSKTSYVEGRELTCIVCSKKNEEYVHA